MTPKYPAPAGNGGITDHPHGSRLWRDLLEQLQPFSAQAVLEQQETGEMGQGDQVRWHQAAVKLPQARYQGGLYDGA